MAAEPRPVVIDASVLVKWLLPEADSAQARSLIWQASTGSVSLSAPAHVLAETANVLWKHALLLKTITPAEANASLRALGTLPMVIEDLEPLLPHAFDLAMAHRRTVYDCLYVALALRDDAELVTADRPIVTTFGPTTGQVVLLAEFDPESVK